MRDYSGTGPCFTTATWRCRKNFSQWKRSFLWKLCCHWLKRLRQRQIAVVKQGSGIGWNIAEFWQKYPATRFYDTVILHWVGDMFSSWVWNIGMDLGICMTPIPTSSTNFMGICWNKRKCIDRSHCSIIKYTKCRHIRVRCVQLTT